MRKKELKFDIDKLFEMAEEEKITLQLEDELYSFKKFITKRYEFEVCFETVCLTPTHKKEIINQLIPESASSLFKGVVNLLIERKALEQIKKLSEEFTRYIAKKKNIAFAEIETVIPVNKSIRQRTHKILKKITQKSIVLKEKISPEILGGFIIKIIGGQVLDATLRHRLWDLKYQIIKAEA